MKNDPKHYREISVPFETMAAGNTALAAFFRDVEAARDKHRIPDVTVICEIAHTLDGEEVRGSASASFGDGARVITMLAREYGAEQARHEERVSLIMAHARKAVRK
jgi:hypothetical protein